MISSSADAVQDKHGINVFDFRRDERVLLREAVRSAQALVGLEFFLEF